MKKLLLFCLFFLLTGCWNYQELNEYAIVTGMAVDYKDDKYEVSFLIANGNKSEQEQTKTSLISGEGETIYNAIKDISLASPKELYVSHLSVVIISEEIAKNVISNLLDYLLREPQAHQNFYLLISKDTEASNILSILSPLSDYPSQNIASNISNTAKLQGKISDASFNLFMEKYLSTGFEPVMNSITIIGNVKEGQSSDSKDKTKQDAYTKLDSLAIFQKDKFVTWATQEESIGIDLILGEINNFYLNVPCENSFAVTLSNDYKVKYTIEKNKIKVSAEAEGTLREVDCKIDLEKEEDIKQLEKSAEDIMRKYMVDAIQLAKNNKTDVFGFGAKYYKKYPYDYHRIQNWNDYFVTLPIEVEAKFQYTRKGSLEQSLEREEQ